MLLDKNGMLWLSTINGLCSYNYAKNRFTTYNKNDGLFYNGGMPACCDHTKVANYFLLLKTCC
jgi:ligand-binding sensor domain-containing protein